jgi:hypothetical protein
MKYYIDKEFIENKETLDLISIGMVDENNKELYLINKDCDYSKASKWVKDNVIDKLAIDGNWMSKKDIAIEVASFMRCCNQSYTLSKRIFGWKIPFTKKYYQKFYLPTYIDPPEIWGDSCGFDFVIFSRLLSGEASLDNYPARFPYYFNDIQQEMKRLEIYKLSEQDESTKHNALEDAKQIKIWHQEIMDYEEMVQYEARFEFADDR